MVDKPGAVDSLLGVVGNRGVVVLVQKDPELQVDSERNPGSRREVVGLDRRQTTSHHRQGVTPRRMVVFPAS